MSWLKRFWHSLAGQQDHHDPLSGLWLTSHDVKMAVARFQQSRESLGDSIQRQRRAVKRLEETIDHIRQSKNVPTFREEHHHRD